MLNGPNPKKVDTPVMARITPSPTPIRQPNAVQQARIKRLRKFNWLFVYTPLLFGAIIVLTLSVWMLWGALSESDTPTQLFLSGMADLILILVLLPAILLGLLGPAALGGLIYWFVRSRKEKKIQPYPTEIPRGNIIQRSSWWLEAQLERAAVTIEQITAKIATQLIRLHAQSRFVGQFIKNLIDRSA